MQKINPEDYRVKPGRKVDLKDRPTRVKPLCASKEEYAQRLYANKEKLAALQNRLYADNRHSLLLIFQAMDGAGKDSAIKHVMSGVDPQGCQVYSFKQPSAEELDHDFLWRTNRCLPERGRIGIFNRSYYEEVVVVRVHPELLLAQKLPEGVPDDKVLWEGRFRSILDLEAHLHRNGTRVLKFFLHLSKEEQRLRFLKRIDDPEKNWKFSGADVEERKRWPEYMQAYGACLEATTSKHAPWYAVPADVKDDTRLIVSRIILDALEGMDLRYPESDTARRRVLKLIREKLAK